jgi:hypothetical protein
MCFCCLTRSWVFLHISVEQYKKAGWHLQRLPRSALRTGKTWLWISLDFFMSFWLVLLTLRLCRVYSWCLWVLLRISKLSLSVLPTIFKIIGNFIALTQFWSFPGFAFQNVANGFIVSFFRWVWTSVFWQCSQTDFEPFPASDNVKPVLCFDDRDQTDFIGLTFCGECHCSLTPSDLFLFVNFAPFCATHLRQSTEEPGFGFVCFSRFWVCGLLCVDLSLLLSFTSGLFYRLECWSWAREHPINIRRVLALFVV